MPTYEYKCDACGYAFERFHSMSASPVKRCPECGKAKVKRLIGTGAGLIFKGSGFYITDYRDKSYTDKAKAESGGGGGGESKDAKSDAKPADSAGATATSSDAKPAVKSEPAPKAETASKSAAKPKGNGKRKK
ncbi:MAG: FmdB family zinc ribbon protein [Tepidisphaeraceae bacterium]